MEMIRVSSSAISAVGYDPDMMQMRIKFKDGKTYTYCGVPEHIVTGLLGAGSKGGYYRNHIKDRYSC